MKVLQFGLGAIGTPIALNFSSAGHEVVAVDPMLRPEAVEGLRRAGVGAFRELADAIADGRPETIVSVLPNSEVVEDVARSVVGMVGGPLLWIDMTTGSPERTIALAADLRAHGIDLVDGPICSGGVPGARNASITVCVGGSTEQFSRASGLLESTAGTVMHVGGIGSGHVVKLLSNYVALGTVALMAEVWALAKAHDLEEDAFWETLGHCAAAAFVRLDKVHGATRSNTEGPVNFRLELARKDMRYLVADAALAGVPLPMGEGAHALYLNAERQGRHHQEAVQAVMEATQG
jgi:2-hydroxy-3-oxopropionate reductase